MEFPRQEYWSGLPFPPPGNPPNPGIEPMSPESPALQADFLPVYHLGSPTYTGPLGQLYLNKTERKKFFNYYPPKMQIKSSLFSPLADSKYLKYDDAQGWLEYQKQVLSNISVKRSKQYKSLENNVAFLTFKVGIIKPIILLPGILWRCFKLFLTTYKDTH